VTIFISTHFMNEAERCDRISLMHAGRVLVSDTPAAILACGARPRRTPRAGATWSNSPARATSEQPPLADDAELDRRLASGELTVAIEIPPASAATCARPPAEVGVWIDGAMPFRGETIRGYVRGCTSNICAGGRMRGPEARRRVEPAEARIRYRYNQDFKSVYAMVPA
jgi:ABC-type glutathione transport system ATPase component